MKYTEMSKAQLEAEQKELLAQYEKIKAQHLKLDMSRGKPGSVQLDLSQGMLTVLKTKEDLISESGIDCRNYGVLDGLPEMKRLIAELVQAKEEQVFIGGNSSLNLMYTIIANAWIYGICGEKPWSQQGEIQFLCPVPGYDRHFKITESLGIRMIPIPLRPDGPDMDIVESYVNQDPSIKGIWCVPQYSNPDGYSYSDQVVRRMAALTPAAPDFRIFWDNAYVIHHLDFEDHDAILNIIDECEKAGHPDLVYEFVSTSKMVFPGNGVSALITSTTNMADIKRIMDTETIGFDKINQLQHVRFFHDKAGIVSHMKQHAAIIRPRFETIWQHFSVLGELGIASWTTPKGGYFLSLYTLPGCAKRTAALCKEVGVILTPAGASYPYGKDPEDHHIRIAPTYPSTEELKTACQVLVICARLAGLEALLR